MFSSVVSFLLKKKKTIATLVNTKYTLFVSSWRLFEVPIRISLCVSVEGQNAATTVRRLWCIFVRFGYVLRIKTGFYLTAEEDKRAEDFRHTSLFPLYNTPTI
jgi:hypothetical protein